MARAQHGRDLLLAHLPVERSPAPAERAEAALARHCERGGGLFDLAAIWVDNSFMIEVLDPVQTARYKERITAENWKRYLPLMLGQAA